MFLLLPFVIWMFDTSLSSEISFGKFKSAFNAGLGFVPGWFIKLVVLALIWAYMHHLIAGLRHLWMDVSHDAVTKEFGKTSAVFTLVVSIGPGAGTGRQTFRLVLISNYKAVPAIEAHLRPPQRGNQLCPSITAPSAWSSVPTMACATGSASA